jgi:hypothetical protein
MDWMELLDWKKHLTLKGLSHGIDFKNFDKKFKELGLTMIWRVFTNRRAKSYGAS